MNTSTRWTVLVAGAANLTIAAAKLAGGVISGSSAMLAEAAHSVADTANEGFLLTSLHRGDRPADKTHPFGYGKERYFWSLLAAVGIFVMGAGFSIFEGVRAIAGGHSGRNPALAFAVLAVAFVAEGASLCRAAYQVRQEAARRDREFADHVRRTSDTTLKTPLYEDAAAVTGVVIAAAGLTLREITGSPVWDGAAAIAIGLLLTWVAYTLGKNSMKLLIGQAADPEDQRVIHHEIQDTDGVTAVIDVLTMRLGPGSLMVAAKVAFSDGISADHAEDLADDIERRLRARLPSVRHVFLDPTQLS